MVHFYYGWAIEGDTGICIVGNGGGHMILFSRPLTIWIRVVHCILFCLNITAEWWYVHDAFHCRRCTTYFVTWNIVESCWKHYKGDTRYMHTYFYPQNNLFFLPPTSGILFLIPQLCSQWRRKRSLETCTRNFHDHNCVFLAKGNLSSPGYSIYYMQRKVYKLQSF